MIITIWNDFLFQPLFNGLIWIYNNWTDQNLGWAVIYLTISLRIALLPLTFIQHFNDKRNRDLEESIGKIDHQFKNDVVLKKQEIRLLLKNRKISPWAKFVSLGIQGLVLVLLYQVFIQGITGERLLRLLYPFVDFPGTINTVFYGFNLGIANQVFWALMVALILFLENYIQAKKDKIKLDKKDLSYYILFPAAVFALLWMLPMVKSLFVLTSILFSAIVDLFLGLIIPKNKPDSKT